MRRTHETARFLARLVCLVALAACPIACSDPKTQNQSDAMAPTMDGAVDDAADQDAHEGGGCVPPAALLMEFHPRSSLITQGTTRIDDVWLAGEDARLAVAIDGCDADCSSNCTFHGPVAVPATAALQRCSTDPAASCTAETVQEDCGVGECLFFFGPAYGAQFAQTFDVCAISAFPYGTGDDPWALRGQMDLSTGAIRFDRFLLDVKLSVGTCPVCGGTDTPFDGKKNGTCMGSDVAWKCDVHGQYAEPVTEELLPSSLDCLVSGLDYDEALSQVLDFSGLSTDDLTWNLTADSPDCGYGGGKCFCGVCQSDVTETCTSAADCANGDECGSGYNDSHLSRYDGCEHTEEGETMCDTDAGVCPFVNSSNVEVACGLSDGVAPGSLNLDGQASAEQDGFHVRAVAAACAAPSLDDFTDNYLGLPGLAVRELDMNVTPLSAEDLESD